MTDRFDRLNRPKRGRPVAVGEALNGYLSRAGLAKRVAQAQVIPDWPGLVAMPESVTPDGVLFVRVTTSAWMNELQLMTPDIMGRLNAGRGTGRITTIRWLLTR